MFIYIFLSITLLKGGKFHHEQCKALFVFLESSNCSLVCYTAVFSIA